MNLRLIAAVVVAAVLSSALSLGVSQLSAASPAQATPRSAAAAPTDSELLAEIADNTATANGKLHVLGQDLQSVLSEEKKVYSINYLGAKRLRLSTRTCLPSTSTSRASSPTATPTRRTRRQRD